MVKQKIILHWSTEKGWEASYNERKMWETALHFVVATVIKKKDGTKWFSDHRRFVEMGSALTYLRLGKP